MLFCIITDNVMHVNIILGNSINNLLIYFYFHAILKRTFQNIQVRHRHTCREARAPEELSAARAATPADTEENSWHSSISYVMILEISAPDIFPELLCIVEYAAAKTKPAAYNDL